MRVRSPHALRPVRAPVNAKVVLTHFSQRMSEWRHQLVWRSNICVCSSVFLHTCGHGHVASSMQPEYPKCTRLLMSRVVSIASVNELVRSVTVTHMVLRGEFTN